MGMEFPMLTSFLLFSATAGATGMSLGPVGGAFGGVTRSGAVDFTSIPAAVAVIEKIDAAMDLGLLMWAMTTQLDGEAMSSGSGVMPMPYMAAAIPVGPIKVGAAFQVPYGGGGVMPKAGGQRFHLIEGEAYLMEGSALVGFSPSSAIHLGASLRFGSAKLKRSQAMDMGAMVNGMFDTTLLPIGDPALEGIQEMDLSGSGVGYGFGVRLGHDEDVQFSASYRSQLTAQLNGAMNATPSNDMRMSMSADIATEMVFPQSIDLGVEVPVGKAKIAVDGGWIGWASASAMEGTMSDLKMSMDDELLGNLTGEMIGEMMPSELDFVSQMGYENAFYGGVSVDYAFSDKLSALHGVWYLPQAAADSSFNAGVMDVTRTNLRTAWMYRPAEWFGVGLSGDFYISQDREVTNSQLQIDADPATGLNQASGNGKYRLTNTRFGLTLAFNG
jgi:long-subunit fatty acid transport protein